MNQAIEQNQKGLYHPQFEKDSCGIGFVANLKGKKTHKIITDAITMLQNMAHRGGVGSEPNTGDGAGILVQVPHQFLLEECEKLDMVLPNFGGYAVGMLFFPPDESKRERCKELFNKYIDKLDLELIGYREVPTNNEGLGNFAKSVEPKIEQVFVKFKKGIYDPELLERRVFILRKYATHNIWKKVPGSEDHFYLASLSHKTIVYKGQLTTHQLVSYYPDLSDERFVSALALIHSRFSTNTFPKWKLAQPFDYIAHNGEINTIRGNVNWMKSKEKLLESKFFTRDEIDKMLPICDARRSDSGNLDSIIEFLVFGGRSLPHAMMMLIPEAWQEDELMEESKRAFYEYYASMMEPWDGPASICFTDGKIVGATLDRNGLRPSRYLVTSDDMVVMASEAGALPVDQSKVLYKGRLQPGKMFIADLEQGRIISDEELKKGICAQQPYAQWLEENRVKIDDLPDAKEFAYPFDNATLLQRQQAFGFTTEDMKVILKPMVESGTEPVGSMGADTPLAILSRQSQHLANYFKQLFAQVSNPPIDPIRERLVMSLNIRIGNFLNMFYETPDHCKQIQHPQPVLRNHELDRLRNIQHPDFKSATIHAVFEADGKPDKLEKAIDKICKKARSAIKNGCNILILSDRTMDKTLAPIPSLLATGAIHHDLIQNGLRAKAGLVVEAGDVIETHHYATLIGYGANAVNPYMAFESILTLKNNGMITLDASVDQLFASYIKAINYGLLKIMSKMGISTLQSYLGAQIFEAVGINKKVIDRCFASTVSRIGGLSFDGIAKEVLVKHKLAFPDKPTAQTGLEVGGVYQWKRRGEAHLFNPETIHLLQQSAWKNDYNLYKQYAEKINNQVEKNYTLRGLLKFKKRKPIPLSEVEPKENIFKRFATGAMSFGSISHEAHSTLAIAMNRIGGKSNSGEGGEDEIRFKPKPNGDWENSAIKQVASGRFGVTSNYLTNASELQIKMAQGAKPGEGGQLPGHKVDEWIGRVRHSTPGVGLISPPPHHDIYSIEDLAQLIYDLKNANRDARINVKLVAETGVGTIAAGVAKAKADVVLISGHDGGTGASPISSIRHAGLPWELGLAEAHQTLVRNNLRSRIVVQTDGQIRTGKDLAIATLLGAEEWGIATAALVVEGCIMMRKCHLNTCPVGIATQNPELRKRFRGKPEYVVNFFTFLAEDLREIMASLGFRTVDEMVGQADALKARKEPGHWKMNELDLKPILYKEPVDENIGTYHQINQNHAIDKVLDWKLLKAARDKLYKGKNFYREFKITSVNRAVGAILSNQISKVHGSEGLPKGTLHFKFRGSAGQSFGAFTAPGVLFELEGEANDYFGKGLSGGQLIIYPDRKAKFPAEENIIIGNVAFYGATSGEAYIRGMAGERFCVRNSGVTTVVEGVGDHGCEYMTGGTVVVLGSTGKNFAAGMSGGTAYVYDPNHNFHLHCNMGMVDFDQLEYDDIQLLEKLIHNHLSYTGSTVAEQLLNKWPRALNAFYKVMPRDYKAALLKQKNDIEKKSIAV